MRRSSMKLKAVIAHTTDPNEIIRISIESGLPPADRFLRHLPRQTSSQGAPERTSATSPNCTPQC
jgi:hypothetical protein